MSPCMTAAAPAYESGWATEIALDVQWAHATAPLARIVLIEAADASLNSLLGGVKLANAMGAGAVSMSFGANEGNYTASVDAAFTGAGMTYLAATGDWGAAVSWPSVSPKVLAVGGTSLSGGKGRMFGTLIGAFTIAVIQNGMNLTNVESYTQKVVLGLVILAAVLLDKLRNR